MIDLLRQCLEGKKILLLGFGREGESSYRLIRKIVPQQIIGIADRNSGVQENKLLQEDPFVKFHCGEDYLDALPRFDLILKSPGISLANLKTPVETSKITSQTDIFLAFFSRQTIGITGTKGKSTTSSLIFHILTTDGQDAVLLGNIGTPAWHFLDRITPQTAVVNELSSHQLEYIHEGPHIALLLNIFEEHLDAYASYHDYQMAKLKITTTQATGDFLLYNADDPILKQYIRESTGQTANGLTKYQLRITNDSPSHPNTPILSRPHTPTPPHHNTLIPLSLSLQFETGSFKRGRELVIRVPGREELVVRELHNRYLRGEHNLRNILAAITACWLHGVTEEAILDGLASFKGLAHRMEELGFYHGIRWVNDSIATIPEACMAAMQSIPEVDTLILGGFDRGISYDALAGFLIGDPVRTLILVGAAGRRIGTEMEQRDYLIKTRKNLFYINRFDEFLPLALKFTRQGATCLLSPAASSYDEFRSFEERGFRFRDLVMESRVLGTDRSLRADGGFDRL